MSYITATLSPDEAQMLEISRKYNESKPLIDYVDSGTYKDFVKEGLTTFLFYGADWCGHCKM